MRFRLASLLCLMPVALQAQQAAPSVSADSAILLADRLLQTVGNRVWAGWTEAPTQLLLIDDSTESFRPTLTAPVQWTRARVFPRQMQATFPAVGGIPTIVIGGPAQTHQNAERWALTALHEHLHQLQYTRPDYYTRLNALGLQRGDTTGMWALNFPFPYDSAPIAAALKHWAAAMGDVLAAADRPDPRAWGRVRAARAALDSLLTPDDRKYLDFQLWQEGVPRWTELALAGEGHARGLISDGELQWQKDRAIRELRELDPAADHRVIVYSLGAAVAELLTREGKPWRRSYLTAMFTLPSP